jgi:hypothetical protein
LRPWPVGWINLLVPRSVRLFTGWNDIGENG